jgi:protein phosphatase
LATEVDIQDVVAASLSDVGGTRADNQDLYGDFRHGTGGRLLVLADGMGGRGGGASASRICVDAFADYFRKPGTPSERLVECFKDANQQILEHAGSNKKLRGMGTTGVALLFCDEGSLVAWVGDSRAYRWRDGTLEPLTQDHSLVQEWVRTGVLSAEEAAKHPRRNELLRAVGIGPELEADLAPLDLRAGDRFLLCSDGLSGVVPHAEIAATIAREAPDDAARLLIERAIALGGTDNITVQVAAFGADLRAAVDRTPEFPPPLTEQVEAALRRRARRAPGLHGSSALLGAGAAVFLSVIAFSYWSRTTARPTPPLPEPAPAVARSEAPIPRGAIEIVSPRPRAPAPAVQREEPPAPAPAEPRAPEPQPEATEPETPPAERAALEPVVPPAAPAPEIEPEAAPTEPARASVPAPGSTPSEARETVEVRKTFEPLAPAETLGLDPQVHAFVARWLEAAGNGDLEAFRSLGFPIGEEEFAATWARWEDFRVTLAEIESERSRDGRVYLRVVMSYAFHDARGRWRTEDDHRVVLAEGADGLRFRARWR